MKKRLLFTYLSELRLYYMKEYYRKSLDKYCGTSRKINAEKDFYEKFIDNSLFDNDSSIINRICNGYSLESVNPVYTFAMNLYSFIESSKNAFQSYDWDKNIEEYGGKYQFGSPNFSDLRDAVQILKVLMMHFTVRHMDRYPTTKINDAMFGIPNPNNWDFLPQSIIDDRLEKRKFFTFDIARSFSYYNSYENMEMFISGKGISDYSIILIKEESLKSYIEYMSIYTQVSNFEKVEEDGTIRLTYKYCEYADENGEKIIYITQIFDKFDDFYIFSLQREEKYFFDVYEYRSFTEDPVITGLDEALKKFKKNGMATKKDVYNSIMPVQASLFLP